MKTKARRRRRKLSDGKKKNYKKNKKCFGGSLLMRGNYLPPRSHPAAATQLPSPSPHPHHHLACIIPFLSSLRVIGSVLGVAHSTKPTSHVRAAPLPRSPPRAHTLTAPRVSLLTALSELRDVENMRRGRRGYTEVREKEEGCGGGGGARRGTVTAAFADGRGGVGRGEAGCLQS